MKKILIASPTADIKSYCFEQWMDHVSQFTYSYFDLYLCDNSDTREYMIESREKYGDRLKMERLSPSQYKSVKSVMAMSHEKCRLEAISGDYDYMLHLETDIFPPLDIIERLLDHNKKVVGALYHIEVGADSKLMVQQLEEFGIQHRESYNLDEADLLFADGELKKVFSCGLGCTLIHKSIFKKFKFRYEEGAPVHPDSFFFGDMDQLGIPVFVDTSILCEHDNKALTRF